MRVYRCALSVPMVFVSGLRGSHSASAARGARECVCVCQCLVQPLFTAMQHFVGRGEASRERVVIVAVLVFCSPLRETDTGRSSVKDARTL